LSVRLLSVALTGQQILAGDIDGLIAQVAVVDDALVAVLVDQPEIVVRTGPLDIDPASARAENALAEMIVPPVLVVDVRQEQLVDIPTRAVDDPNDLGARATG
jgi:hypothetical protein